MKKSAYFVLLVCLGACFGHGQSPADAESKVRALEQLWGEAAQFRDIKALESIFDDSLVYVHIDGRLMTKGDVLADTMAVRAVEIVVESSVAHSHGTTVIVAGVLRLKGVEGGKPHLRHGRFVDTWLYKEDRWLCVASMTTPIMK